MLSYHHLCMHFRGLLRGTFLNMHYWLGYFTWRILFSTFSYKCLWYNIYNQYSSVINCMQKPTCFTLLLLIYLICRGIIIKRQDILNLLHRKVHEGPLLFPSVPLPEIRALSLNVTSARGRGFVKSLVCDILTTVVQLGLWHRYGPSVCFTICDVASTHARTQCNHNSLTITLNEGGSLKVL
jgi:hypothetical protein